MKQAIGDPLPKLSIRKDGMQRPFQFGDPRIKLDTKLEKDETILLLTYFNTVRYCVISFNLIIIIIIVVVARFRFF